MQDQDILEQYRRSLQLEADLLVPATGPTEDAYRLFLQGKLLGEAQRRMLAYLDAHPEDRRRLADQIDALETPPVRFEEVREAVQNFLDRLTPAPRQLAYRDEVAYGAGLDWLGDLVKALRRADVLPRSNRGTLDDLRYFADLVRQDAMDFAAEQYVEDRMEEWNATWTEVVNALEKVSVHEAPGATAVASLRDMCAALRRRLKDFGLMDEKQGSAQEAFLQATEQAGRRLRALEEVLR